MTGPGRPWPAQPCARSTRPRSGPAEASLAAFARQVLGWHQPSPTADGRQPWQCTCGSPLVLCPYRDAATRHLGPPGQPR